MCSFQMQETFLVTSPFVWLFSPGIPEKHSLGPPPPDRCSLASESDSSLIVSPPGTGLECRWGLPRVASPCHSTMTCKLRDILGRCEGWEESSEGGGPPVRFQNEAGTLLCKQQHTYTVHIYIDCIINRMPSPKRVGQRITHGRLHGLWKNIFLPHHMNLFRFHVAF